MKQTDIKRARLKKVYWNKNDQLKNKVDLLYRKIISLWGGEKVKRLVKELELSDQIHSKDHKERLTAMETLLQIGPTRKKDQADNQLETMVSRIEEVLVEQYARKTMEEHLEQRIQDRVQERYQEYLKEVEIQVIKELNSTTENAQTLKKYGQLEMMERTKLNDSAFEILRPQQPEEVVGQETAIKSIIAKLNTPYPQHILLYGPPGVGKTTCARLALEMVKGRDGNPFTSRAPFVEVDGTALRWDPRESTNPLLGSVHDPIYQGARRELADQGIPEPKLGLVSDAHGGILFIDEIGEMDLILQSKLLKVLEDKRVHFESSYYDPLDEAIPRYIKQIFELGVPADFVLIGATTRRPEEINPAFRSRCMEIFLEPLSVEHIKKIVHISARKLHIEIAAGVAENISWYAHDGRSANKILVDGYGLALNESRPESNGPLIVQVDHIRAAIHNGRFQRITPCQASETWGTGKIFGLGVLDYNGALIELEAVAFPAESLGQGKIRFNDTAGSMTKDSVFNAASVFRKETGENLSNYDVHINIVGGGKVDGPSAGVAIFLAILSAIQQKPIRQDIAVTGELSVQGRIKPIGAIHEKIAGARQAGIKKILVPKGNLLEIPHQTFAALDIIPLEDISEAYYHVFGLTIPEEKSVSSAN